MVCKTVICADPTRRLLALALLLTVFLMVLLAAYAGVTFVRSGQVKVIELNTYGSAIGNPREHALRANMTAMAAMIAEQRQRMNNSQSIPPKDKAGHSEKTNPSSGVEEDASPGPQASKGKAKAEITPTEAASTKAAPIITAPTSAPSGRLRDGHTPKPNMPMDKHHFHKVDISRNGIQWEFAKDVPWTWHRYLPWFDILHAALRGQPEADSQRTLHVDIDDRPVPGSLGFRCNADAGAGCVMMPAWSWWSDMHNTWLHVASLILRAFLWSQILCSHNLIALALP